MIRKKPNGFTLLEMILAIGILALAMAALGESMRQAVQCASYARDVTRAQCICESRMSEIISGITTTDAVSGQAVEDTDDSQRNWTYSITSDQADDLGTLAITVTATYDTAPNNQAPLATLTRWIVDPTLTPVDLTTAAATDSSTDTGTTSGGTQ